MKYLTFSFDDGVTQDIRFIELLNKYGLKGTFNLNSLRFSREDVLKVEDKQVSHYKINAEDVKSLYQGHEVAAHTLNHPDLKVLSESDIIKEVEEDRLNLSELCGYEVKGFAYPGCTPNYNQRVADVIKNKTGIKYCRTVVSSNNFDISTNLHEYNPSVWVSDYDKLFELGEKFLSLKPTKKQVFYVFGHTYEFDLFNSWGKIEEFMQMMSNKKDIIYATNSEALL